MQTKDLRLEVIADHLHVRTTSSFIMSVANFLNEFDYEVGIRISREGKYKEVHTITKEKVSIGIYEDLINSPEGTEILFTIRSFDGSIDETMFSKFRREAENYMRAGH